MEKLDRLLAEHPFFEGLDPKYTDFISGCAANAVFKPGEFLFREGGEANRFFIIRHGTVALEISSAERGTVTILTVGAGEILGWSWLFPPYRWQFDARAMEPVRAIGLDGRCLREKCERDHDLGYELMKRLSLIFGRRLQATRLQLLDVYAPRCAKGEVLP